MTPGPEQSLYAVAHLGPGADHVPEDVLHGVFKAPWRQISRINLEPGDELGPRRLADSEVMLFVIEGHGTARTPGGEELNLAPEIAVTLIKGELLHVKAQNAEPGMALYLIEIGAESG